MNKRVLLLEEKTENGFFRLFCEGDKVDVEVTGDMTIAAQTFFLNHLQEHIQVWTMWKHKKDYAALEQRLSLLQNAYSEMEVKSHAQAREYVALDKKYDRTKQQYNRAKKQVATMLANAKQAKAIKPEPVKVAPPKQRGAFWFLPSLFIREGES